MKAKACRKLTKPLAILLCALTILSLSGCFLFHPGTPEEYQVPEGHYRLQADFSNGLLDGRLEFKDVPINSVYYDVSTKQNEHSAMAHEAAVMELAGYLSEWTGLDFTLNSAKDDSAGVIVDWSKSSTLLAGMGDRDLKEGFRFDDAESLNWFMMDTLKGTILTNLPYSNVYYYSDGVPLEFGDGNSAQQSEDDSSKDGQYYGSYYYLRKDGE